MRVTLRTPCIVTALMTGLFAPDVAAAQLATAADQPVCVAQARDLDRSVRRVEAAKTSDADRSAQIVAPRPGLAAELRNLPELQGYLECLTRMMALQRQ